MLACLHTSSINHAFTRKLRSIQCVKWEFVAALHCAAFSECSSIRLALCPFLCDRAVKSASSVSVIHLSGLCLSAAAMLAGCAAPVDIKLDSSVPEHWQQSVSGGHPAGNAQLTDWWKSWGDTRLNELVDEALAQNLDLSQAVLRLRQQKMLADTARSPFLPIVSTGARTLQDIAAIDSYFHASVDVSWDLGLFGDSSAAKRAGMAGLLDAQAQLHAARVALVADVVHRYLDIRLAQKQRALLEQLQRQSQRQLELLTVRRDQRLGPSAALEQQRLWSQSVLAQQAAVVESQARAAHALAALLGRDKAENQWLQADAGAELPKPQAITALPADMLRSRPDIQSAEAAVERAAAALGVSRAALYPRFTITGSILYSYNLTQNLRTTSDQMPLIGPQIDIPLFDWGRRRAQADANELALQASIQAYRQNVLNGIAEAETALAAISAQQKRQQGLQASQEIYQARGKAQAVREKLGLGSELDGMDTRRAELQTQSDMVTAQAAEALAYISLYKALGAAPLDMTELTKEPHP